MDNPRVFVIIVNWNLKYDTIALIRSILTGSYIPYRVIVVDNGSSDGSVEAILEHFGDAVDLIVNKENIGFAAGANRGIHHALTHGADFVLILNNDTIVARDMLEKLIDMAIHTPDIGILSPAIFYYDQPNRVWYLGDRHVRWLPIPLRISANMLRPDNKILLVNYVTGCAMLIRRSVLDKIGMFDERYFMYYEDADFCKRAEQAGFSIACVPAARVWHKVSGSTRGNISYQYYLKTRSRVRFYRRHYSCLAWGYLILSTLWIMLVNLFKGNKEIVMACVKGFYHGWRVNP